MTTIYRKLSPQELSQSMAIRIKVFVEEQNVPMEEEKDGYDDIAQHFGIFLDNVMIGTGRLIISGDKGKLGRIAILKEFRGKGYGGKLIKTMITEGTKYGLTEFILGAQLQAIDFYQKLGFEAEGEIFQDGGIPHRTMRLKMGN
ncbi:MAG: GNAT family N-acetyltransferase [Bacillota bacterium]|nr:GNAT family N-acetyltransferase [Bacillota bacterium]